MAEDLKVMDPSIENKHNYDLIIQDRDVSTLKMFVNYCDYSGFDRSISSIESSQEYIASHDYEWMEATLQSFVDIFK